MAQRDDEDGSDDGAEDTPFAQIEPVLSGDAESYGNDLRVEEDVDGFDPPVEPAPFPRPAMGSKRQPSRSSAFTIPLLCAGVAILACSLIIPAADENRQLTHEREALKADLAQLEKQIAMNDAFLKKLSSDPGLSERLAQRQMRMVREGTSVLELNGQKSSDMSPFLLVSVPPPPPMPAYQPIGGAFSSLFREPKSQLYLTGAALLMMAVGLVLGSSSPRD
jgi:cell division protein FtsB